MSIAQEVEMSITEAERRLAERQQAAAELAAEQEAQRQEQFAQEWAPLMATLRNALPEWAQPYVVQPDDEHEAYNYEANFHCYRPIPIVVPSLAPIGAYVYRGEIYYYAVWPSIDDTDDDRPYLSDTATALRPRHEITNLETDFAIAILHARDARDRYDQMVTAWTAKQLAAEPEPPVPAPNGAPPDILRLAQDSLQAWEREAEGLLPAADFDGKQAQLRLHLAACIDCRRAAIASERTAVALESIAAALMAVVAAVGEADLMTLHDLGE